MYEKYRALMDDELKDAKTDTAAVYPPSVSKDNIISIVNQKGGCAKTTTAINLSACLALHGNKVLLIDADPQAQASLGLGFYLDNERLSLHDILTRHISVKRAVLKTHLPGLDIIAANSLLSGSQIDLVNQVGRDFSLKNAMQKFFKSNVYDYVIVDCSPTLNLVTLNVLVASHYVLIPFQTHYYSLEGMRELLSTIDIIKARMNSHLQILGIVAALYDGRNAISKKILLQARNYFKDLMFKAVIRFNIRLSEAPIYNKTIFEYAETSHGSIDYRELTREVIHRVAAKNAPLGDVPQPLHSVQI